MSEREQIHEGYRLDRILLSREEIASRVDEIAGSLAKEMAGRTAIFVTILKGASIFASDLVRAVGERLDVRMDFMAVSSYGNSNTTSGVVKIVKDMDTLAEGRDVIIVEDIMDTGLTLSYLTNVIRDRGAASLRTCVLLEKPERRKVDCKIDHTGFTIPDEFVVGYGLDFAGKWRHLPDIWTLTKA